MNTGLSRGQQRWTRRDGQSIVEAVVVLALVAILVITVFRGVGMHATTQLQTANDALEEQGVASSTGPGGGGGDNSGSGSGGGGGSHDSGSTGSGSGGGGLGAGGGSSDSHLEP